MKIKKSELKTARVGYLHNDGHLVLVHEKKDRDAGKVEWITIYENAGITVYMEEGKRLIIGKGCLPFLLQAKTINVHETSVNSGSEKTKALGLALETIELFSFTGSWFIHNLPGVLSSDLYTYESNDKFVDIDGKHYWGDVRIKEIHKDKK